MADWGTIIAQLDAATKQAYQESPMYSMGNALLAQPITPAVAQGWNWSPWEYAAGNIGQALAGGLISGLGEQKVYDVLRPQYLQVAEALPEVPKTEIASYIKGPEFRPAMGSTMLARALQEEDARRTINDQLRRTLLGMGIVTSEDPNAAAIPGADGMRIDEAATQELAQQRQLAEGQRKTVDVGTARQFAKTGKDIGTMMNVADQLDRFAKENPKIAAPVNFGLVASTNIGGWVLGEPGKEAYDLRREALQVVQRFARSLEDRLSDADRVVYRDLVYGGKGSGAADIARLIRSTASLAKQGLLEEAQITQNIRSGGYSNLANALTGVVGSDPSGGSNLPPGGATPSQEQIEFSRQNPRLPNESDSAYGARLRSLWGNR